MRQTKFFNSFIDQIAVGTLAKEPIRIVRGQLLTRLRQPMPTNIYRARSSFGLVALSLLLASCQSGLENSGVTNDVAPPSSTAVEEQFGSKGTEITLLLEKGGEGYFEGAARDVRDGAELALGELGGDQVHVKVVPIDADAGNLSAAVASASERKSALLVSYAAPAITKGITAVVPSKRPLLINLGPAVSTGGGGIFNFEVDETDSIVQGASVAIAGGTTNFLLFVQKNYPADFESQVSAAVGKVGGKIVGTTRFNTNGAGVLEQVKAMKDKLGQAGVALIAGNTMATVNVVSALKAEDATKAMAFVGTSGWPETSYSAPAAKGVLVVTYDKEDLALIADRYSRHYKRPVSDQAAYGYDIVALASGLIRAKGEKGLEMKTLLSKSGFKGLTGRFQFNGDGSTSRRLVPYSIANGRLNPLASGG